MIDEKYIVMFSSGITSWYAARRLVDSGVSPADILLLFADTKIEDEDNYRFLEDAKNDIGSRLEIVADGRTPWETFKDGRFIANSRVDICSRVLKREVIAKWLKVNAAPAQQKLVYGMSWDEAHRIERVSERWKPWECLFPLNEAPYLTKKQVFDLARERNLKRPRLYDLGFEHANCGGFCVKAGKSHFVKLLQVMPERYLEHEEREREFRQWIGKDVTILRKTVNGANVPMTMQEHRENIQAGFKQESFDFGGCGCFAGDED